MSMIRKFLATVATAMLVSMTLVSVSQGQAPGTGPSLETPEAKLAQALVCPVALTSKLNRDPVLLVHGTGSAAAESWSWNYAKALPAAGFAICTIDLPDNAAGDIQISAEYVVYAIRKMNSDSGRKVATIGHSQGGIVPQWALKWWPDLREKVSDSISLAATHHGAGGAIAFCNALGCGGSVAQQLPSSRFLAALNRGADAWGPVDYTSIFSATDEVVYPPAQSSTIKGGPGLSVSNVLIQGICPANKATHGDAVWDAVYWAVVMDALLRPGPADASRIGPGVCAPGAVPGVDLATAAKQTADTFALPGPRLVAWPKGPEPALKAYVTGAVAPGAPRTGQGVAPVSSGTSGGISTLFLGGLLAALGIGTAAFVGVRRKR